MTLFKTPTIINLFLLIISLSIIYSCGEVSNKKTSTDEIISSKFELSVYYSSYDSASFRLQSINHNYFNLIFNSTSNENIGSIKKLNASWIRIEWKGLPDSNQTSSLNLFPLTGDTKFFEIYSKEGTISKKDYIFKDSISSSYYLRLSKYISDNPHNSFLALHYKLFENSNNEIEPNKVAHLLKQFDQKFSIDQIQIVSSIKKMDSLLTSDEVGKIGRMLANDYFEDGVLRDDKIRFYTYIASKIIGFRFEYGNFKFFHLKDGRTQVIYDYRMFEGDSIWDLGVENRYFKKIGKNWKETGNQSRFYTSTLSSKYMKGDVNFQIYLPPQYFKFPKSTFPVIYVFDDFKDLTSDWVAYNFDEIMDTLINRKKIDPSIVIFMDGGPSLYMKSLKQDGYNFEDFFLSEAGPNFDTVLRITKKRERRYLTGIGQGGLAAMYYYLKYPTIFYSVSTINGVFKNSLQARHLDQGKIEYWNDKYPEYYLKKIPDYILKSLHFKLIQNPVQKSNEGFNEVVATLKSRKANLETFSFQNTWQENLNILTIEAFGWHLENYKRNGSK